MKRIIQPLVFLLAVGGLIWFGWLRPAGLDGDVEQPRPEVAVHVATVVQATLRTYVTAYGRVGPEPAGPHAAASAALAPSVPGVVMAVHCTEGQYVAKGELLFELDHRVADVTAEFAGQTLARQQRLIEVEGTSEQSLQDAELNLQAARVQQALLKVRSPLSGTVTRVNVNVGEAVDLTTVLADVVDLDRLVASASIPGAELAALAIGQPVEVRADGGTEAVTASLAFISPVVDAATGTAQIRAALPADANFRPGQLVTMHIVSAEHRDRLAVPVESVVQDAEGVAVLAVVRDGYAVQIPVTTGIRDGGLVEVEAGDLRAGMTIVTEGAYGLPGESRVRILGN